LARRKLTVDRKAHRRKSFVKDVKKGRGVKLKRIPATTVKRARFKIEDIGAVGRGRKVIKKIRKGRLSRFGYSTKKTASERRRALRKADRRYGSTALFRMLQAQVVLRKRIQPKARKVFEADRNWVKDKLLSRMERLGMTAKARAERQLRKVVS